jgi:hypothetical protein
MKRFYGLLFACLLLALPLTANAGTVLFGSGTIYADGSLFESGYALNYAGSVTIDDPAINIGEVEIFCVSGVTLNTNYPNYDFYRFTDDEDENKDFAKATWVADNWEVFITEEGLDRNVMKGEAQKAIWKILDVMDITGNAGWDYSLFEAAQDDYLSSNWLWAKSVEGLSQDFLVPYEFMGGGLPEVPEPSTLILLGLGLTGIALYKKKR